MWKNAESWKYVLLLTIFKNQSSNDEKMKTNTLEPYDEQYQFQFSISKCNKITYLELNSKYFFLSISIFCFPKSKNISSNKSSAAGKFDQNNSLKVQFSPPNLTRLDNMWHGSKHDSAVFLFSHPPGLAQKTAIIQ